MPVKLNWDAVGIATSILCAIHCALLPLVLTSLPLLGINIIHNGPFEWFMIGMAFLIGAYSLSHGYRRHHHSLNPILLFSVGFFFLAAKQFTSHHIGFLSIAVICIISAHYQNFRLCHKNKCADPHHRH